MADFSPNLRYDHVFAIVRVDTHEHSASEPTQDITVTKVVWSREDAEAEVTRLNRLNGDKGATYFWQGTRLTRRAPLR